MTIGENIKKFRKRANLTQKQLAEKCGLAQGTIQQYELNKREPRLEQRKLICEALNIPIYALILGTLKYKPTDEELKEAEALEEWLGLYSKDDVPENTWNRESTLLEYFRLLNKTGELKALEQVELLTKVPEYRKNND